MPGVGFIFGWAKPVPINFRALRSQKSGMIWVALAGPGANFVYGYWLANTCDNIIKIRTIYSIFNGKSWNLFKYFIGCIQSSANSLH